MSTKFWKIDANDELSTPDDFDNLESTLSAINGGDVQMAGVNLLSYATPTMTNNTFPLNIATNVYRLTAPITSGEATIPVPDRQLVPQSNQYYYFEMEVAIDSSATSLTSPSGWTWVVGGELPASGYAGKTLYVSVRLDCQTGDYLANVWRLA